MGASTMSVQLNQEPSRDQALVNYPPVNGRVGRIVATVLLFTRVPIVAGWAA
jgi:hypothetical protein